METVITDPTTAESAASFGFENIPSTYLIIVTIALFITLLIAAIVILKALKTIIKVKMPDLEQEESAAIIPNSIKKLQRKERWNKIWGLNPLDKEEEIMIDHEYDGIRELDNPIPMWFNALFYSSIVFAIGYLLIYHVIGWGMTQDEEYQAAMQAGEKQRIEFLESSGSNIDENSVTLDLSPEFVAAGQEIFLQNCGMCHGNQGEGLIGPNLADEYWIHGGEVGEIFRTIKYGVPEKGMVPWEANLTPVQIAQVSNFILSLVGTNPPNPKDPEGEKKESTNNEEPTNTEEVKI